MSALFALAAVAAPPTQVSSVGARRVLQEYARCVVRKKRAVVSTAIIEDWSIPMMIERDVITSDCLSSGQLSPSPESMKGALGELLVATDKNDILAPQLAGAPPLALRAPDFHDASNGFNPPPPPKPDVERAVEIYRRYIATAKLGDCVVRSHPQFARALLGTKIGTGGESQAASMLRTAVSNCGGASAETVSAETIRNAIGLAYYRLEAAARGTIWRPAKGEAAE